MFSSISCVSSVETPDGSELLLPALTDVISVPSLCISFLPNASCVIQSSVETPDGSELLSPALADVISVPSLCISFLPNASCVIQSSVETPDGSSVRPGSLHLR